MTVLQVAVFGPNQLGVMAGVASAGPASDVETLFNALPSDDEAVADMEKSDNPKDTDEKKLSAAAKKDDDHTMQQDSPCYGG